jgi:hypothetical protein
MTETGSVPDPGQPDVPVRHYKLLYDDREPEFLSAETASNAVQARQGAPCSRLPHTVVDMTAMAAFSHRARSHAMPLRNARFGEDRP